MLACIPVSVRNDVTIGRYTGSRARAFVLITAAERPNRRTGAGATLSCGRISHDKRSNGSRIVRQRFKEKNEHIFLRTVHEYCNVLYIKYIFRQPNHF